MCCDDITKVVIGSRLNIFKVTGSLDKYVRSIITDEIGKSFAKSSNRQGVFEILEMFKKQVRQFIRPNFK